MIVTSFDAEFQCARIVDCRNKIVKVKSMPTSRKNILKNFNIHKTLTSILSIGPFLDLTTTSEVETSPDIIPETKVTKIKIRKKSESVKCINYRNHHDV